MKIELLKKFGFSDKTALVYTGLLQLGPSSVRGLAEHCELNRGSTYEALKWLEERELVSFYEKESKQHFVAAPPTRLLALAKEEVEAVNEAQTEIKRALPELEALYNRGGEQPVARYFGEAELPEILNDVLSVCEQAGESLYRVYSTEGIRDRLYASFPTFSDVRVGKGINVRVISLGAGGSLRGLDERKWLAVPQTKPTYIILYPGKAAYISLNTAGQAVGVVIANEGIAATQIALFDALWQTL